MRIFLYLAFVFAGYIWGDWKNWRRYYPTYLFLIGGNLFYNALLHNQRLWYYRKGIIGNQILNGHLTIAFFIMVFVFPSTILIYLGNFPKQRSKQFFWILLWIFIYTLIEFISNKYLHWIEYNQGWNIYWSILFNLVMFTVLKFHYSKPWLAWIISVLFFIFLYNIFNIPKESFN
jgi:hypothetical protein